MRISIFGKNLEVTDYLRETAEKKAEKLNRYFPEDTEVQITLSVEKNSHIAEVTVPFEGGVIRAEEATGDMYASLDSVLEKIEKQLHRHRTRLEKTFRGASLRFDEPVFSGAFDDEPEEGPKIVRVKRFNIKPMDEEEAMLQLELTGHSFYVFENADTAQINVLYKRKDGNYGLIEPEN